MEGEYPKLLKLQNELINRLNQLQTGFSELEMDSIDNEGQDNDQINEKEKFEIDSTSLHNQSCSFSRANFQLNQCFDIFEKSYLAISLSRLSDPINLMFSSSTTRSLPSQQELENLIKVMTK